MRVLLRKFRGALGLSATWGIVWAAIFAVLIFIVALFDPDSIDPDEGLLLVAGIGAVYGFASGAAFGVLLSLGESGKSILGLSPARGALWGALASAVYPLVTPVANTMLVFLCPIGAALGAGAVLVAKKAELAAVPRPPQQRG